VSEGANGKIAVTYFEWAGPVDQKIVLPWRLVDGPESAAAAAAEIAVEFVKRLQRQRLSRLAADYRRLR
jgi:Protein of unknown function (DUF1194)